jgi:hypothetical protein
MNYSWCRQLGHHGRLSRWRRLFVAIERSRFAVVWWSWKVTRTDSLDTFVHVQIRSEAPTGSFWYLIHASSHITLRRLFNQCDIHTYLGMRDVRNVYLYISSVWRKFSGDAGESHMFYYNNLWAKIVNKYNLFMEAFLPLIAAYILFAWRPKKFRRELGPVSPKGLNTTYM